MGIRYFQNLKGENSVLIKMGDEQLEIAQETLNYITQLLGSNFVKLNSCFSLN